MPSLLDAWQTAWSALDARPEPALFDRLLDYCENCEAFYRVDVWPDSLCDGYVDITTSVVRGIRLSSAPVEIEVLSIYPDYDFETKDFGGDAIWDGETLRYNYVFSGGYDVAGEATFPAER